MGTHDGTGLLSPSNAPAYCTLYKASSGLTCSLRMRSSMVPAMMKRVTWMGLNWPSRWILSCACCSTAGFHLHARPKLTACLEVAHGYQIFQTSLKFERLRRAGSAGVMNMTWETAINPKTLPPSFSDMTRPKQAHHGSTSMTRRHLIHRFGSENLLSPLTCRRRHTRGP